MAFSSGFPAITGASAGQVLAVQGLESALGEIGDARRETDAKRVRDQMPGPNTSGDLP